MNSNTYMDKQIMDLSNSQNNSTDFIDFMNRSEKKEEPNPSYNFMTIRQADELSSSNEPQLRSWNSFDLKTKASPIRNYGSLDADEPEILFLNKNQKSVNASPDASWISEMDRTLKKYTDNLMHAMDGVSARLSQLETRTGHLENMVDDLKVSVGNNNGSTDGKMRQIENILREVQTGVVAIRDKQEIVDAQLKIAKLNVSAPEQVESLKTAPSGPTQQGASSVYQQFPTGSLTQPPPTHLTPNAPPQQSFPPQVQIPNQFPQSQVPSVPQQETYFPPPGPTPENPSQHYQVPPPQQQPQQHHQYHSAPQQPYSQPPPHQQPFSPGNPQLPHHQEESPYPPPQTYPPTMHQSPPTPSTMPPPPSQQYYGSAPSMHEPPPSRPGPGYSGPYSPSSGHVEPYPYTNSPSQYGSGSPLKRQQQPSSPFTGQSGGSGYPQLPTARILPQALPTASAVGGGSSSGSGSGSGNKVSIDDVVDKVTHMGFSRDQVRATVRKLTENGQSVDLNIVLDKLMNGGDDQAPRGWLSR